METLSVRESDTTRGTLLRLGDQQCRRSMFHFHGNEVLPSRETVSNPRRSRLTRTDSSNQFRGKHSSKKQARPCIPRSATAKQKAASSDCRRGDGHFRARTSAAQALCEQHNESDMIVYTPFCVDAPQLCCFD